MAHYRRLHRMDAGELSRLFGVQADAVEPLPFGEAGESFRVRAADGREFHLKSVPALNANSQASLRRGFYLGLIRDLRQSGVLTCVPRMLPASDGSLCAESGDDLLVLSEWIEGPPVHPLGLLPRSVRLPLARTLGALHAGTPRLRLDAAPVEDFSIPFESGLRDSLRADLPRPVRELIAPRSARIEEELAHLLRVRDAASALGAPHVLCHTDVHGGNLILDPHGSLWVLDWEDARLAPCEQDLAGATNAHVPREEFGGFVDAYVAARGEPVTLHAELFEFYYRRRCLEDLEAFLDTLQLGRGEAQDRHDMDLIESECLAWLDRMDDDVAFVRTALSDARA